MATTSALAITQPATAAQSLRDAVNEFRNVLDEEKRRELDKSKHVPNANDIFVFTARLDGLDPNRRGRSFSSRLLTILSAVRNFCSIADTFVSAHPEIAALVWGSVKLTMMVMSNVASYYEATSDLFMRIGRLCPLFDEYLMLYQSSARLRKSLIEFHTSIVHCCKHVVEAVQRPWGKQILQAFWNSFEQEFESDIKDIRSRSDYVKEEIALAQAQVNAQEQQLQTMERENACRGRSVAMKMLSRTEKQMREWEIQRNARKTQKRRKQLLDELSRHDHLRPLQQSRSKRYSNTLDWIFQTAEFRRWVDGVVPLLCCFGKIGSGKTIATSRVIDHILSRPGSDCLVSFFFAESGNQESLSAETIIRSILRQRLNSTQTPQDVLDGLERLDSSPELNEFVELLRLVMPPPKISYVIIDGLDECEKADRDRLLKALSSFIISGGNIRLLLASRDSVRGEIQNRFPAFDSFLMDCPPALNGIARFIEDILEEKLESGELTLTDDSLKGEIKQALSDGAQGMFLWVTFQIHEICAQHCDEDIRTILRDLPRNLTEVYCRVLRRIQFRGHQKEARKFFPWIAACKQFLSLSQLREAIAIEVGQQYSKPERFYHKMENITSWCENLVQVDEEYQLVQFSHSTIKKFLTEEPLDSTLAEFHVNIAEADHEIGEICVTYLNFNDFKTTVARRPKPILVHDPAQIAQSVLKNHPRTASVLATLRPKVTSSKPVDLGPLQTLTAKGSSASREKLVAKHPFLDYALRNWLLHTRRFRPKMSKMWKLWENMVLNGHSLAKLPGGEDAFNPKGPILTWACDVHHYALLRLVMSHIDYIDEDQSSQIVASCVADDNDADALNTLLEDPYVNRTVKQLLRISVKEGYPAFVERLIAAGTDINAPAAVKYGRTALQAAAGYGHIEIVERLLAAGADINAPAAEFGGQTALQAACTGGYFEIVKTLLAAGADINAPAAEYDGLTALQAAEKFRYHEIMSYLRRAGARK